MQTKKYMRSTSGGSAQGMEDGVCWGRLMRMRVAEDHGLRSWVRSIDRVEYSGVGCAVSSGGRKRAEKRDKGNKGSIARR